VPYHSRWRHFESGGPGQATINRWQILCERAGMSGPSIARSARGSVSIW
jgi:hypothetical protein